MHFTLHHYTVSPPAPLLRGNQIAHRTYYPVNTSLCRRHKLPRQSWESKQKRSKQRVLMNPLPPAQLRGRRKIKKEANHSKANRTHTIRPSFSAFPAIGNWTSFSFKIRTTFNCRDTGRSRAAAVSLQRSRPLSSIHARQYQLTPLPLSILNINIDRFLAI